MLSNMKYYCETKLMEIMKVPHTLPYLHKYPEYLCIDNDVIRANIIFTYDMKHWARQDIYVIDSLAKLFACDWQQHTIVVINMNVNIDDINIAKYLDNKLLFMRVINDGCISGCKGCANYYLNIDISLDTYPDIYIMKYDCTDMLSNYPIIYIDYKQRPLRDKFSVCSAMGDYKHMLSECDIKDIIGNSTYVMRSCGHLSMDMQCNKCDAKGSAMKINLVDGYCLLTAILTNNMCYDIEKASLSGNNDVDNPKYKYLIISKANKYITDYITKICRANKLSISINKATRDSDKDVKLINNAARLDKLDYDIYSHIIFIAAKKHRYKRVIRHALNLYRATNLHIHII